MTNRKVGNPQLERDLLARLLDLNYHAFLQCIGTLLERAGYQNVRLAGRTGFVGRNSGGGYDLYATDPIAGGVRQLVVQAKQYAPNTQIYRRGVDELRGVCLRAGAAEGLLITTGQFSPTIDRVRIASTSLMPVRTIDGMELARLLQTYHLGIWEEPLSSGRAVDRGVDHEYFRGLEQSYSGVARANESDQLSFLLELTVPRRKRRQDAAGMYPVKQPKRGRIAKPLR